MDKNKQTRFFIVKHDVDFMWRDVQPGMPHQLPLEEIDIDGKYENNGQKTYVTLNEILDI